MVVSKKKENKKKTKSKANGSDEEDGPVDGTFVLFVLPVSSTIIPPETPVAKGKKGKGDIFSTF